MKKNSLLFIFLFTFLLVTVCCSPLAEIYLGHDPPCRRTYSFTFSWFTVHVPISLRSPAKFSSCDKSIIKYIYSLAMLKNSFSCVSINDHLSQRSEQFLFPRLHAWHTLTLKNRSVASDTVSTRITVGQIKTLTEFLYAKFAAIYLKALLREWGFPGHVRTR